METTRLSNKYLHTLERIYEHPTSHNLEWHDVIALVEHLGTVEEAEHGHITLTVNDVSHGFHRAREKDVSETHQVLELRHFLEGVGIGKHGAIVPEEPTIGPKLRLLVAITDKETLVFRSEDKDSLPEQLHPHDPHGMLQEMKHRKGGDIVAQLPENITYYKAIAATLTDADEILLMGSGTGASSAMDHLNVYLNAHHAVIASKVVGTRTLDLQALTEGQILKEARAFFAERDSPNTNQ